MAIPTDIAYSGSGSGSSNTYTITNNWTSNTNQYSGPDWIENITGNLKRKNSNWFALDLCGKYNKDSRLKKYHLLTFYFRHENQGTNKLENELKDCTDGKIITCALPESFSYSFGSDWGKPFNFGEAGLLSGTVAQFSQGAQSLSFAINTALTWQNAKTMALVFKIPVFDDVGTGTRVNYQEALELFGQAALPKLDKNGMYESIPGPSIINEINLGGAIARGNQANTAARGTKTTNWVANQMGKAVEKGLNGANTLWDRISVQVGGLLLLDYCVIKDVKVNFPNTRAMIMHNYSNTTKNDSLKIHLQPQICELEVTVETAIGMTRDMFTNMLQLREYKDATKIGGIMTQEETGKMNLIDNSRGSQTTQNMSERTDIVRMQDEGGMSLVGGGEQLGMMGKILNAVNKNSTTLM